MLFTNVFRSVRLDLIYLRCCSLFSILGDSNLTFCGIFCRCVEEGCGRAFTASHHLKTHKRTHSADKLYSCDRPNCNKTFPGKASLKTHQRSHDIWDESETLSDFTDDLLQHFDCETNCSTSSEFLKYHSTFSTHLVICYVKYRGNRRTTNWRENVNLFFETNDFGCKRHFYINVQTSIFYCGTMFLAAGSQ